MILLAASTATNVLLAILTFNVVVLAFLHVLEVRERHANARPLYLPREWEDPDWDFPPREPDDLQDVWR